MRRIRLFVVVLALVSLARCGESEEWRNVRVQAGEAWDAVKSWGVAKRGDAERYFSRSVESLTGTYEAAKAKAQAAGGDAATALGSRWSDVSAKLADLKAAGADSWEQARESFVRAYESLQRELSSGA